MIKLTLLILLLSLTFSFPVQSQETYSTLPGWSAGYRYYFDMDVSPQSRLRLFGKYKYRNGDSIKFGWDKQTGKDLNQFSSSYDSNGVLSLEQEFKF